VGERASSDPSKDVHSGNLAQDVKATKTL